MFNMSQNFQILIKFFESVNKSAKIYNLINKTIGANFTSRPFGYEPKNIFFFPGLDMILKSGLVAVLAMPDVISKGCLTSRI